jgi:hypothetical protein
MCGAESFEASLMPTLTLTKPPAAAYCTRIVAMLQDPAGIITRVSEVTI